MEKFLLTTLASFTYISFILTLWSFDPAMLAPLSSTMQCAGNRWVRFRVLSVKQVIKYVGELVPFEKIV